ncbi:MAG: hypothetical protein KF709_04755 [Gemmatimonadaceae bacterium]|nr:hypothetical protein [Gemmatimonadaceae bacterium]
MPVARIVSWTLVLVLFAFALGTYGGLPEQIPTGIDASGNARGLRERSLLIWLLVPLMALLIQGMLEFIRASLPRRPHWFNFPDKDRFLRLPARFRPPVIEAMRATLDITAAVGHLPLFLVQYLIWQTAIGNPSSSGVVFILVGSAFIGPVILITVGRVGTATEEAERRWKAEGSPTE